MATTAPLSSWVCSSFIKNIWNLRCNWFNLKYVYVNNAAIRHFQMVSQSQSKSEQNTGHFDEISTLSSPVDGLWRSLQPCSMWCNRSDAGVSLLKTGCYVFIRTKCVHIMWFTSLNATIEHFKSSLNKRTLIALQYTRVCFYNVAYNCLLDVWISPVYGSFF